MLFFSLIKAVFLFLLLLGVALSIMYIWANVIDRILLLNHKLEPKYLAWLISGISLLISVILAANIYFFIVSFFLSLPVFSEYKISRVKQNIAIQPEDCPIILQTIAREQEELAFYNNHRYIEEKAPLFTIKIQYERGAEILREEAKQFAKLPINKNSKYYTNKIAEKLNEKAELFEQRVKAKPGIDSPEKVLDLLNRMDRVTEERLNTLEQVKKQCSQSN